MGWWLIEDDQKYRLYHIAIPDNGQVSNCMSRTMDDGTVTYIEKQYDSSGPNSVFGKQIVGHTEDPHEVVKFMQEVTRRTNYLNGGGK